MADIKYTADDLVREMAKAVTSTNQLTAASLNLADAFVASGGAFKNTEPLIKKMTDAWKDNRETFKTIKEMAKDVGMSMKDVNSFIQTLIQSEERLAKQAEETKKKQQEAFRQAQAGRAATFTAGVAGQLQIPEGTAVSKVKALQSAFIALEREAAKTGLSVGSLRALFTRLSTDPTNISAVAGLGKVQVAILQVIGAYKSMQKAQDDAGGGPPGGGGGGPFKNLLISWQGLVRLIESQVIRRGFIAIVNAMRDAIAASIEFSAKISQLQTLAGQAGGSFTQWEGAVRRLSERFAKPQTDVAEAAYQALSSQLTKNSAQFELFGETTLKLAQATGSDAAVAANLLATSLNAFGLGAESAEASAGILFKMFEGGRVKLSDINQSFGRLSISAGEMGISFKETAEVVSTLTQSGVRFADATSMINSVIAQLLKPTDELKRILSEAGLGTPKTAIQLVGLRGVLQVLRQEAEKGSGRLGELEGTIRAMRATLALTSDAAKDLGASFGTAQQAIDELNAASARQAESPGQKLRRDMEQLRNFFTDEVGKTLVQQIEKLSEPFGGVSGLIKKLIEDLKDLTSGIRAVVGAIFDLGTKTHLTLKDAVTIWYSFKTGIYLSRIELAAFQGQTIATIATTQGLGVAAKAAGAALKSALAPIGIGIAVAAISLLIERLLTAKSAAEELAEALDRDLRAREEASQKLASEELKVLQKVNEEDKKLLDERYRNFLIYTNKVKEAADQDLHDQQKLLKDIEVETKNVAKSYTDNLGRAFEDATRKANEFKKIIEDTPKGMDQFRDKTNEAMYNLKMKYANGYQQVTLLKQKDALLEREQYAALSLHTKEGIDEAKRLGEERIKITEQIAEHSIENQRKAFDEDVKAGRIRGYKDEYGQERVTFAARTQQYEQQIANLYREQIGLQLQAREIAAEEEAKKRDEAAELKEQQRVAEELIRDIAKAEEERYDVKGRVKPQYRETEGKPGAAVKDVEEKITKLAGMPGVDPKVITALWKEFYQFKKTANAEARRDDVDAARENFLKLKDENDKAIEDARRRNAQMLQDRRTYASEFIKIENQIRSVITKQVSELPRERGGRVAEYYQGQEILKELQDLSDRRAAFKEGTKEGRFPGFGEWQDFEKRITAVWDKIYDFEKAIGEGGGFMGKAIPKEFGVEGLAPGTSLTALLKQALQNISAGREMGFEQGTINKNLADAQAALTKAGNASNDVGVQQAIYNDLLKDTNDKFKTLAERVGETTKKIMELGDSFTKEKTAPTPTPPVPLAGAKEALGGALGGFIGGPRGRDVIPAWLSAGEFVMNPYSTAKFFPQLLAMNRGQTPQYFSSGGPVTTNIGDIVVNMQGGGATEDETSMVRRIAQGIRREMRRGSIGFQ